MEIVSFTDNPSRFDVRETFFLNPPLPNKSEVRIAGCKRKKGGVVLVFEDLDTREDAEKLQDRELLIEESSAVKPAGSYWVHDIIGCEVVTEENKRLGTVVEVSKTGANDVYVVEGDKRYYVPAVKTVVLKIDIVNRLITIRPLPGLLEL